MGMKQLVITGNGKISVEYRNGFYELFIDGKSEIYHEKLVSYVKETFVKFVNRGVRKVSKIENGHLTKDLLTLSDFSNTKKDIKVHYDDVYEEYVFEDEQLVAQTDKINVKSTEDVLVHWVSIFFDENYK